LGSGPLGTRNIMNHPFFAGFDWDKLYNRQIEPPFKPHLRHIMDTKFFSEEFTGEPVKDTFVDSNISTTHQAAFAGFSWHPPNEFLEKANNSNDAGIPDYAKKRRSRRVTGLKLNGPASSMQLIGRESPASGGDAASPLIILLVINQVVVGVVVMDIHRVQAVQAFCQMWEIWHPVGIQILYLI